MRVLLIYPPISSYERYSSEIGNSGGKQVPLGVFYLAAYLRRQGHRVSVIDAEARGLAYDQIIGHITAFRPDLIGISSTTVCFHRAHAVASAVKTAFNDLPIVLGGPHITASPEDAMGHDVFDIGVIGEGEETLGELVDALENNRPISAIRGLAFRDGKQVRITPRRPPIDDLDTLPFPAFDMIDDLSLYRPPPCNYKALPALNVITSRGCPSRCTFCDRSVFGERLRQRSAENIAEEIESLYRNHGVREIAFVDDTLTLRPQRIVRLFTILDKRGISLPWTCMSQIATVDMDFLKFMRDHGCWHISFGIESGNPDILRRIRKNISLKSVHRVISWCHQLGILTKGFFILGHPGETLETIDQTIQFAIDLPLDDVVVTLNTPLPGSQQYEAAAASGNLEQTDWSRFNMWNPVFVPDGMTAELLTAKHREFYRRFYLRPRIITQYALSFLSASGLLRLRTLLASLPFLFRRNN